MLPGRVRLARRMPNVELSRVERVAALVEVLSEVDGFEATRLMIVALSADEERALFSAGRDDFLAKPLLLNKH